MRTPYNGKFCTNNIRHHPFLNYHQRHQSPSPSPLPSTRPIWETAGYKKPLTHVSTFFRLALPLYIANLLLNLFNMVHFKLSVQVAFILGAVAITPVIGLPASLWEHYNKDNNLPQTVNPQEWVRLSICSMITFDFITDIRNTAFSQVQISRESWMFNMDNTIFTSHLLAWDHKFQIHHLSRESQYYIFNMDICNIGSGLRPDRRDRFFQGLDEKEILVKLGQTWQRNGICWFMISIAKLSDFLHLSLRTRMKPLASGHPCPYVSLGHCGHVEPFPTRAQLRAHDSTAHKDTSLR